MKLRIAGLAEDSIVDGPGFRLAVFFQGCPHGCPGCHNPHTHDPAGGYEAEAGEILAKLPANPLYAGITLTGGEPLYQPEAAIYLAKGAKDMGLNVMLFTGFTFEEIIIKSDIAEVLRHCDWMVEGPYIESERSLSLYLRGSKNQRILDCPMSLSQCAPITAELDERANPLMSARHSHEV